MDSLFQTDIEQPASAAGLRAASGSGAFLSGVFGLYFTPASVIEAITPRPSFNILDVIANPPTRFGRVRAAGLCWKCKEAKSETSYCADCLKVRNKERRMNRIAHTKKCFCGLTAAKYFLGAFVCQKHYETDKAYLAHDRAKERDEIGIKERRAASQKAYRLRRKKAGLCQECSRPREKNHRLCAVHRASHNGWTSPLNDRT